MSKRSKKVVAILTIMVLLFTMIPTDGLKVVQAATGDQSVTLYDLSKDSSLKVGEAMSSPALEKAGGPTINVVQGSEGPSLHVSNVVNSWDGVDLLPSALKQSDGSYLPGSYTFTIKGHVDSGVAAAYTNKDGEKVPLQMVFGMSADPYSWFNNQIIAEDGNGSFTLTYTTTYAKASDLENLAYKYRIQKAGDGNVNNPTSFYIDGITVKAVPKVAEPITLYDLNKDSGLAGGTMASTSIEKAGNPTIDVVNSANGSSLHLTNVVNSWDGVDLKPTALLQQDGSYLPGAYTFTVKGHVDSGVAAAYVDKDGKPAPLQMVFGMSADPYSWFANQTITTDGDGKFTLTYTTTYTSASDLENLKYNFRIQKAGDGLASSPTSFYIDGITVNVVPSTGPEPEVPDITLPVGQTAILYDLNKDSKLSVGGAITDSPALAKSGDGEVSIVQGEGSTLSLHVNNRVNNWDGVDLKRAVLMHENAYYAGDYTFTVKGHIDPADVATSSAFVLGMNQSPWGELTSRTMPASDGSFTLTYTKNYSTASITNLGYDFRIQTTDKKPTSFYIDNITVTVTGSAPKLFGIYSLPFNDKASQGSFFSTTSTAAQLAWVNGSGIGHSDDAALKVTHSGTDYNASNNAVRLTLPKALPAGATYNISAWVYVPTEGNEGKGELAGPGIVINGKYDGATGVSKFPSTPGTITTGEWKELNVTLPKSTSPITSIDFNFVTNEASSHPNVWRFDNIMISQVGDRTLNPKWDTTLPSLANAYKKAFLIGNIMEPGQTTDTELTAMYKNQYNVVTAENAMKPDQLSKSKDQYSYTEADKLIKWAQDNNIKVHAHTLVWHSQSADWLNKNSDGSPLTRSEAQTNMKKYIDNVVGHFAGKVISWDVVNEAFTNDIYNTPTSWQSVLRGASGMPDTNPWYAAYANHADETKGESGADFIYDAFVFTRLADSNVKLYYNDYNETEKGKYEAIGMMVEQLNAKWKTDSRNKDINRPLIEGVGMQAHYWTEDVNLAKNAEAAIQRFIKAGADVSVSELDIPIGGYTNYKNNTILTYDNEKLQADLYKQLFEVYDKYTSHIDRVTFWGKADSQSWRSEGYPNLFDASFAPKLAYYSVMDAAADIVIPPTQYNVIFNSQGGSTVDTITAIDGSTVNEPMKPTKTGFTFGGWYKDSACTTANKWDFTKDTVTTTVTLYAKWTVNQYRVTFKYQNGSLDSYKDINYNDKVPAPNNPTKTGYTFGGWYKDSACTTANKWDFANNTVKTIVTLYAKWTVNQYKVTFKYQNGSQDSYKSYAYNSTIPTPKNPTKNGYTFGGWYKDASYKSAWNFKSDKVSKDTILYAKWTINKYSVIYNSVGGSKVSTKSTNYNTLIATPTAPTKSGYTFLGWYKDSTYKTIWNFSKDKVTKTTYLYAKWAKNPSAPGKISVSKVSSKSAKISWSKVSGVKGYELYRATSKSGKYSLISSTTGTSYTNKSLSKGKTYYYKVRAYKMVDNRKVYSSYTKVVSIKF